MTRSQLNVQINRTNKKFQRARPEHSDAWIGKMSMLKKYTIDNSLDKEFGAGTPIRRSYKRVGQSL